MSAPMFFTTDELAQVLAPHERLVGLDPGTKTIGVALSDVRRLLATPVFTIHKTRFGDDMDRLEQELAKETIGGFIIGHPLNMDGSSGPRAQACRAFGRNVAARFSRPVLMWDERLSTHAAEDAMIAADVSRAKRRERIDAAAATIILQSALDALATAVVE